MRRKIEHYDLWVKFQSEKNEKKKKELERKLVEIYYPLVEKIAYSMAKKMCWMISPEELASLGVDGLYIAINKYSLERGASFSTYSNLRIRGSMVDGMRKADTVPRTVRMNHSKIEKTRAFLESEKGRIIRDEEILEELGINKNDFNKNIKNFYPVTFTSLDGTDVSKSSPEDNIKKDSNPYLTDEKTSSVESFLIRKEFFNKLMGSSFSRIEQKIIYLYYYRDFTMDKIASALDLSESRVSQIHKDVIPRLRDKIRRNPRYFTKDVFSLISNCNSKDLLFNESE